MLWVTLGFAAILFGVMLLFIGVFVSQLGYAILGGIFVVYGIVTLVNLWRAPKSRNLGADINQ
jgi:hypothetical protein